MQVSRFLPALAAAILAAASAILGGADRADPFAFFAPSIATSAGDRDLLDRGGTIARVVPGTMHAIAIFSATRIDTSGERLVAWIRDIVALKKTDYVPEIGRFSDPPQLADIAPLTLEAGDIDDLRGCRREKCGLKLAAAEFEEIQRADRAGGRQGAAALQDAFRGVVLRRVQEYASAGHSALPTYVDRGAMVSLQARFAMLLHQSPFLGQRLPDVATYLERWPESASPRVESFLYWSKERFGAKPVISVTHVMLVRGDGTTTPEAVAIGKQVFATHYMDASLSVTAIVRDAAGSQRYLAYLNRTDIDVLGGFWGGLVRRILERRLRSEAPALIVKLRERLESGAPPAGHGGE